MSGRRESPRTAFRARRKSGRRPIPIIYIGEIIRPLFSQSGSGAVFVVVRAVSATPYRKTISPQTAQLSLLLLSLSMIGTTDGFLSDKSIRKLNDSVNTTLSMTPNPIFIKRCRIALHRTDRNRVVPAYSFAAAPPSMANAETITIFSSTLLGFETMMPYSPAGRSSKVRR